MTNQEIFNVVFIKILVQNELSFTYYHGGYVLRFLSEKIRSPVGWLLKYDKCNFYEPYEKLLNSKEYDFEFINILENIHHDIAEKCYHDGLERMSEWKKQMMLLANNKNLTIPIFSDIEDIKENQKTNSENSK